MIYEEPLNIIADIISHEMDIPPERVYIYNDDKPLPKDTGLYLVMSVLSRPNYSSTLKYKEVGDTLIEVKEINFVDTVIASLVSEDNSARVRLPEALTALNSTYAQQLQEKYACHISKVNVTRDNSFLEHTARMNRQDIEIRVMSGYSSEKPVDYYNAYKTENHYEQ